MTHETKGAPKRVRTLRKGTCIGRYAVIGLVGRGAMGEVYSAYDPELDRKVAVKLLRSQPGGGDSTTTDAKARLLREAQAIAKLSHPNVIAIHDVGSFDDRVFMAMELVDGCTVGYWLASARRPWREVLRVFTAAGHGLAAAHASGLVHRDFKAENVMLGRDHKVRVMDFGLARRIPGVGDPAPDWAPVAEPVGAVPSDPAHDEETLVSTTRLLTPPEESSSDRTADADARRAIQTSTEAPAASGSSSASPTGRRVVALAEVGANLTQTGAVAGTPAYMAPEQFVGGTADERSDQFSFCVALYEGLYGERPFPAKSPSELFAQVRRGEVRPAPTSTTVPVWVRRVVLRGMHVEPLERWPSMNDLLIALHRNPRAVWRRAAISVAAVASVVGMAMAARQQGVRESRPACNVPKERFAGVWEPKGVEGGRRTAIAAAFRASGRADAAVALQKATSTLDRYVAMWSATYTDNCIATNVRREQPTEVFELRLSCLADRWNEVRALSDILVDPNAEVVDNAADAALDLKSPGDCGDVEALRAGVSRSIALWTTPGTMSLVAPRARHASGGSSSGLRTQPTDGAAQSSAPEAPQIDAAGLSRSNR